MTGTKALALCVAFVLLGQVSSARAYEVQSSAYRKAPRFRLTYSGSGSYQTIYHSNPANAGGYPDANDAEDTSTQVWQLAYRGTVRIPSCGPSHRARNACLRVTGPMFAAGSTSATGQIDHTHIDGLYSQFDAHTQCSVESAPASAAPQLASVSIRYVQRRRAFLITALDPVIAAVELLPPRCPSQVDPIDGLYDNYFTPGFSFATGYGPNRWFTAQTVAIPAHVLHRAARIAINVSNTRHGAPPAGCAVPDPATERCSTGGSWAGVLTLTAVR